jgi:hypothetical protein
MNILQRVTTCVLIASLFGLAGCPVGMNRYDGQGRNQGSQRGHQDDSRDNRDHSRHDDNRDHPPNSDENRPQ